jgi:hypothetical protein
MLKKNYTIEMIKDYTDSALNEHYKKIWQVLENI